MAKKTIPRTCENCQTTFLVEAHTITIGKGRFCSVACSVFIWKQLRESDSYLNRVCLCCGKRFHVVPSHNNKFCSKECRAKDRLRRFWDKVNRDGPVLRPELGPCWVWTGSADNQGYGFTWRSRAHRRSWVITNGPIPTGLGVLHRCDNPPCVRPEHLFLGTKADNMRDMAIKERSRQTILNASQVREIRQRHDQTGETARQIAADFNVNRRTINNILEGATWSHVS